MQTSTIEIIKERWTCVQVAEALGLNLDKALRGPCPRCGGTDRFYIHKRFDRWNCRVCQDKHGDVIDLVAHVFDCDNNAAIEWFNEKVPAPQTIAVGKKDYAWTDPEWQAKAARIVEQGRAHLAKNEDGRLYLEARGLTPETWEAWRFGFCEYQHQSANAKVQEIVLPWYAVDKICNVRYRKIDPPKGLPKLRSQPGSESLVCGLHLAKQTQRAIFVEGEINGASLWQATKGQIDCMSFGGETQWQKCVPQLVRAYDESLIWVDRREIAGRIAKAIPGAKLKFFVSPGGKDANDILAIYGDDALSRLVAGAFE
jgi:phage/plasmid primase-like uncharacterized protein